MTWTDEDVVNMYPLLRSIVATNFTKLDALTRDMLVQEAAVIAWKGQYRKSTDEWYITACVQSAAYDLRLSCVDKQNAMRQFKRAEFTSLEDEMMSHHEGNEYKGDWEPVEPNSYFHSDFEFMTVLLEKGSELLRYVVRQIVQNSSTLVEIAQELGMKVHTLRYRFRTEAKAVLGSHGLIKTNKSDRLAYGI